MGHYRQYVVFVLLSDTLVPKSRMLAGENHVANTRYFHGIEYSRAAAVDSRPGENHRCQNTLSNFDHSVVTNFPNDTNQYSRTQKRHACQWKTLLKVHFSMVWNYRCCLLAVFLSVCDISD
jgi:hypothetical protein